VLEQQQEKVAPTKVPCWLPLGCTVEIVLVPAGPVLKRVTVA